jgi:hypothetical protein
MNQHCQAEDTLAFSTTEYQSDADFQWLTLNPTCTNFLNLNHPYITVLFLSKSLSKCNLLFAVNSPEILCWHDVSRILKKVENCKIFMRFLFCILLKKKKELCRDGKSLDPIISLFLFFVI